MKVREVDMTDTTAETVETLRSDVYSLMSLVKRLVTVMERWNVRTRDLERDRQTFSELLKLESDVNRIAGDVVLSKAELGSASTRLTIMTESMRAEMRDKLDRLAADVAAIRAAVAPRP